MSRRKKKNRYIQLRLNLSPDLLDEIKCRQERDGTEDVWVKAFITEKRTLIKDPYSPQANINEII